MAEKQPPARSEELSDKESIREKLLKGYEAIDKAFLDAADRIDDTLDYWKIFNCEWSSKQYYQGDANAFVPIVHDAIEARKTRFVNQVFPETGRYVDVITDQEEMPSALIALIDHYIEFARVREIVLPALFKNGDVEGQWNIYIDWTERTRHVTTRMQSGPDLGDGLKLDADMVGEEDTIEDTHEEEVLEFGPSVEVIPDADVCVIPAIADTIDDALFRYGGSVTILRRWSKEMIERKIADGDVTEEGGEELLARFDQGSAGSGSEGNQREDTRREHVDSAGIKSGGGGKFALVYETWRVLEVDDTQRLTRTYYGSDKLVLSCKLNPFWCDLCPLLSGAVDKVSGSFKGISKVQPVEKLQYLANDYLNQGADSASLGLNPVIATDPSSNPRASQMVITQGAVWEVNPATTKFMEFPHLWVAAEELVESLSRRIMQTLGVNPSMITQRSGSKKPTQAEIAAEQVVDMMTTADVIIPFEAGILTPMIARFVAYDQQFRREAIWVRAFGREGIKSGMQEVPPQQAGNRVQFRWLGVEAARTAAQMQQQIAFMNVLRTIPPEMMPGRKVNIVPLVERACESVFGPHLGPKIFPPISDLVGVPPEAENQLLGQGVDLPVHPEDNDAQHLAEHAKLPPSPVRNAHMQRHQVQMSAKNQMAAQQAQQQQGGGGGRGPQAGAQTKGPGRMKQPPGALKPGQMAGGMPALRTV
jgi:hypothetical protein